MRLQPSFFRSEKTGKAKSNPLGTTGAHNGPVNLNGVIVLGKMKFQHHLASHRNALACAHAAPSERQIRQYPFDDDAPARIAGWGEPAPDIQLRLGHNCGEDWS